MNELGARELLQQVLAEVAPDVDPAELAPDADLRAAADLDSMDFLALLEGLSEQTGLDLPESDYEQLTTVDGIVGYLTARVPTTG